MLHKSFRKWSAAVAATIALTLCAAAAQAFTPPPFPRIGGIQIGGPFNYNEASYESQLARQSLMILNYWPGMAPGGESMDSVVKGIKAINPNALVFLYTDSDEQFTNPSGSADATLRTKLDSMKWWLYTGKSLTGMVSSFYGDGGETINNTPYTPKDSSGQDSIDWIGRWFVSNYYKPNPHIDGFFMDNVFTQPRVAGDWYRNGVVLQPSDPRAGAALQAGYERWFNLERQLMPGKFQIGNVATWASSGATIPSGYHGMVDGGVMEAMIGKSYSIEGWGGWQAMMAQYRSIMAAMNTPKLGIFNQWGDPTDYQAFRYGLASCLMNDAYYSFSSTSGGYTGVVWFDEYNANLGKAQSAPPTGAWQKGVWRRDFTNGIALVNPKGNGPRTVLLGGTFVKIKGTQDRSVNSGQTVSSVTLQDRDGIILLRKTPVSGGVSTGGSTSGDSGTGSGSAPEGDTFGRTDVASTPSAGLSANFKRGSKFTLGVQGTLTSLSAYLDGNGGASGEQSLRMELYRDSSGVPGAKVAESNPVTVSAGEGRRWVTFSTPYVPLNPGRYWVVLASGYGAGVARDYGDGTANWYGNGDDIAYGTSDPFGDGAAGTGTLSLYASYNPGDARSFGRTTVAATPSAGLAANFKRGSRFSLSQQADLRGLSAYLDGNGGAAGTQSVRMALYRDANGVPGAKVLQSSTVSITDHQAPGWVNFRTSTVALTPGAYWIVIQSGSDAGVVRDYGGGTGGWYGNDDAFSDGAANSFGAGSRGAGTLSVYATYTTTQTFGRTDIGSTPSAGLSANFKRGSKFTFDGQGTLASFSAYLDGKGGSSGEQSLRMVLYRDAGGVPGSKVAESATLTISAGQPARWVAFTAPAISLSAGTYWVVIDSGYTTGIARDYGGDGGANWYGAADSFSDGASASFGDGSSGTGTLSAYVSVRAQ